MTKNDIEVLERLKASDEPYSVMAKATGLNEPAIRQYFSRKKRSAGLPPKVNFGQR